MVTISYAHSNFLELTFHYINYRVSNFSTC